MALIRYPGSKAKLSDEIIRRFPDEMKLELWALNAKWEYREPFFGAGAIGCKLLMRLPRTSSVWLNDIDPWLVCLWESVWKHPRQLIKRVEAFRPSADAFYQFKSEDGSDIGNFIEAGFRKLALHQMSVSGFGAMSGGPLGGRNQGNSLYTVDCRWNPERLSHHIATLHKRVFTRFDDMKITCGKASHLLNGANRTTFIYLDPPYIEKGAQLYKYNMTEDQHRAMSAAVKELKCPWVLSYDDAPLVRELYSWANIDEIEVTYTNSTHAKGKRPKNREVVITPAV